MTNIIREGENHHAAIAYTSCGSEVFCGTWIVPLTQLGGSGARRKEDTVKRLLLIGLVTVTWATAATALTADQKCYSDRAKAKAKFDECVGKWLAKVYAGADLTAAVAQLKLSRCRERYAATWTRLSSLTTGPCNGNRFADNADGTVTDKLTGLTWEKKTGPTDFVANYGDPHDMDNQYWWSNSPSDGDDTDEDGTAFTDFLTNLNAGGGFAGANGWRLPTLAELLTLLNQPFGCAVAHPCIDTTFGYTVSTGYRSATTYQLSPTMAWTVGFTEGLVNAGDKTDFQPVRAVRGGL